MPQKRTRTGRPCGCLVAQLCLTLWPNKTVAHQPPLSMEFSWQEYWNGLPFSPPGESFQPRNHAHVSCISCTGRWVLYHCATREAPCHAQKVLFSCSHSIVTSSLGRNPTPGPPSTAISVLPLGLGLDISCLVISHHRKKHPSDTLSSLLMGNGHTPQLNTFARERKRWGPPTSTRTGRGENSSQVRAGGPGSWFFS